MLFNRGAKEPLPIADFLLLGKPIAAIEARPLRIAAAIHSTPTVEYEDAGLRHQPELDAVARRSKQPELFDGTSHQSAGQPKENGPIAALRPYPEYRDSGLPWLGQVPKWWEVKRAKSIFQRVDERSTTGKEELLTVSSARGIIPRKTANVTMFKAESYRGYKLCWPGDLVINSLWAWAGGLGVSRHHGIVSSAYGVYRIRPDAPITPPFVHEVVRSSSFNWELRVRSKGVWISRLQLTDVAFLDAPIHIPPPAEQMAIVRFLDWASGRLERTIRAKRKVVALLTERKKAIIARTVTRGLDPSAPVKASGFPEIGKVPRHWEILALKRVLRKLVDCEHKTAPAVDDSEYRVVRTTGIRHGALHMHGTYCTTALAFRQWTRRGPPEPGDVMFTREAPAGEACTVPTGLNLCLGQRTVLMKPRPDRIDPQFLVHLIYAGPPRTAITLASQGSTVGHFNMSDIGALSILLPPVTEQVAIVQSIAQETRGIDELIRRTEQEIDLIREYQTRIVADVVTGKVDVREAVAKFPAEPEVMEASSEAPELSEEDLEETLDTEIAHE